MEKRIPWNDGDGDIILTYVGEGNGTVIVSSDVNEGIDRQQTLQVRTEKGLAEDKGVWQEGRREEFILADGEILSGSDKPFYTIKDGLQ